MSFPKRRISETDAGGHTVTVRTHRDLGTLIARAGEGELIALDRRDLDAATARALLAKKPWGVINGAEFISGRFANLGPQLLAEAGVVLLETDREHVQALTDGGTVRVDGSTLYDGAVVVADVHVVEPDEIERRMDQARTGLAAQLDSFAHTTSEFLRREEGLLLHGTGAPALRTDLGGKTVVVVGPATTAAQLRRLRTFLREQRPVLIGVDAGGDLLARKRRKIDVLVLSGAGAVEDRTLARTSEVVLNGTGEAVGRRLEKRNLPSHTVHTSAASADLGLLLAHLGGARLVVPTGSPGTLEEFIDRSRSDQASNVLSRLRLGGRLVEADAVPLLYTGRVRRWQLALVLLAAVAVLAFTVAATPIGQDRWDQVRDHLPTWVGGR
ncbi:MAG: hypothetical protein J7518_06535 [Nocardioidaceae bacterium]|nr:hypothetical protein [Nocardioidaceae bacterium]